MSNYLQTIDNGLFFMLKNMVLCIAVVLGLASAAVVAADGAETENVQELIHRAGYECDKVDRVEKETETKWFDNGTTIDVVCDKAFRFKLHYQRNNSGGTGVSVEVAAM
ncbi:hypothetical protein [Leclercia adecarboxylata]|uniref:hypothetical protein n=1 Tax=Leclercia adecarboxylata TaxID=83655 RepID=UPI001CEF86E4|nr:hypothetical protein [Leclercia adecarboxylata]